MSKRRVVVTGLGMVSPLGNCVADSWTACLAGKSGIGPITRFDTTGFPVTFAGSVPGFDASKFMPAKEARRMDLFMQYGVAAGVQAIAASGLAVTDANRARIGLIFGSGIGGLATIEENYARYLESRTPRKISPFYIPASIVNMISGHLSIIYGVTGPNLAVVTACTTSTHAIGIGMRTIQYGDADVIVAGGAEMAQTPTAVGGFCQARAVSTRNDDPERASRPWDRDRDGFVMGDGAGAVVLEEYEHAKARNASIHAELIGFGMSGDAHHITAPPENGTGAMQSMVNALRDARINPDEVQYINAHATSTMLGDVAETIAIKDAFGPHARKLAVSSTKSMTGHLLGAAGVVEAIFSILAIRDQTAPPTINLDNPGERCDLDYVPKTARRMKIDTIVSNSFGFGGTNGTLVFRALR
ncbi:MAG: beta-ketoacyl-[acyl-carrier-protein] synthase II [Gammaproteobacteria bacterium]|nr:beta-ketoacyl-[acyl-carrier-protein] synthase II [Gammaproteobacteria bacterium]